MSGRRLPGWMRWLHIYASMLALFATLLFAVTGLTLNHADWFESGDPAVCTVAGKLAPELLGPELDKLAVAERLRHEHGLQGMVTEFQSDDPEQCFVIWKGPGYSADATIERGSGDYKIEVSRRSWFAVLDDLHKGRDCGPVWGVAIDVSAGLLTFLAVTGLWLLFYLKKRRRSGLLVALAGTVLVVATFVLGVA